MAGSNGHLTPDLLGVLSVVRYRPGGATPEQVATHLSRDLAGVRRDLRALERSGQLEARLYRTTDKGRLEETAAVPSPATVDLRVNGGYERRWSKVRA